MITLDDLKACVGARPAKRAPRLAALAEFINANLPGYEARMEEWSGRFDRRIGHTRLVHQGVMHTGKVLRVYRRTVSGYYHRSECVIERNPFNSYHRNSDIAEWILRQVKSRDAEDRDGQKQD